MAKQQIVTAPCVIARDSTGHDRYIYRGAPLPEDVPAKEVKRLQALGVLADADAAEQTSNGDAEIQTPKKSATAGEWTAYAVSQGMDAQLAASLRKADLVAHYHEGKPLPGDDEPPAPPADRDKPPAGAVDDTVPPPAE